MHKFATDDERDGININIPREGHATVVLSSGSWMTFPDEAWPKAIAAICEQQALPSQRKPPIRRSDGATADAAPMKCTVQQINKLIERVRSGQPPILPDGSREQHYNDPALPGFYIRLLSTGVATWTLQWKRLGRQKKIKLGYVLVLDRIDAIKAAKELLAKVTLGTLDPHQAKRERMRANKVTFAVEAQSFLARRQADLRPGTMKHWKNFLQTGYYLRPLHKLPLDEITTEQLQTQIDKVVIQSGNNAAWGCCTALSVFFQWALDTRKLPQGHHNPMTGFQYPPKSKARGRVLTDDEIRLIWKTCEAWEANVIHHQQVRASTAALDKHRKAHYSTRIERRGAISAMRRTREGLRGAPSITDYSLVVRLLFLTGCRAQEIGDLQRSEIDLDNGEIKIPAERTKDKRLLFNPLSDWAVQILRGVEQRPGRDSVFGHTNHPGKGQNMVATHLKINERIIKAGGTPPKNWTLHDIRRTFRTRMAALGVSKDVGEALLGHGGHRTVIEETYDLYDHWPEKRQALAMWEANLRAILDGTAEKIARPRFGERKEGNTA